MFQSIFHYATHFPCLHSSEFISDKWGEDVYFFPLVNFLFFTVCPVSIPCKILAIMVFCWHLFHSLIPLFLAFVSFTALAKLMVSEAMLIPILLLFRSNKQSDVQHDLMFFKELKQVYQTYSRLQMAGDCFNLAFFQFPANVAIFSPPFPKPLPNTPLVSKCQDPKMGVQTFFKVISGLLDKEMLTMLAKSLLACKVRSEFPEETSGNHWSSSFCSSSDSSVALSPGCRPVV